MGFLGEKILKKKKNGWCYLRPHPNGNVNYVGSLMSPTRQFFGEQNYYSTPKVLYNIEYFLRTLISNI